MRRRRHERILFFLVLALSACASERKFEACLVELDAAPSGYMCCRIEPSMKMDWECFSKQR